MDIETFLSLKPGDVVLSKQLSCFTKRECRDAIERVVADFPCSDFNDIKLLCEPNVGFTLAYGPFEGQRYFRWSINELQSLVRRGNPNCPKLRKK